MTVVTVRTGAVIALLLLTLLAMFRSSPEAVPLLILAVAVHKSPGFILGKLEKRRREELSREFPRMVDNVRIFAKASDIYTALKTVHQSLRGRLAEEMRILSVDMEMNDLEKALANFSMRCGLRQAYDFSSVVLQAAWSGMEVDGILSNYSKTAYEKRLGEIRRRIKARPLLMTVIPAILLLSIMLLWLMPIYNSIINQLRSF
jgi:Flp pilus assembly protein TadB